MPISARKFGCEFEFSTELDECRDVFTTTIGKHDLYFVDQYHSSVNNKKWHLKRDNTTESELATPVSTIGDLTEICGVIRKAADKLRVTSHDGFHVHVASGDVDERALVAAWLAMEDEVVSMFPRTRRANENCIRFLARRYGAYNVTDVKLPLPRTRTIAEVLEPSMTLARDHHAALSTKRRKSIGTVEFRIAEGTLDHEFVRAWTRFCLLFVEYAKRQESRYDLLVSRPNGMTFEGMIKELHVTPSDEDVLWDRRMKFSPGRS